MSRSSSSTSLVSGGRVGGNTHRDQDKRVAVLYSTCWVQHLGCRIVVKIITFTASAGGKDAATDEE